MFFSACVFTSSSKQCAYIARLEDDGRLTLNGARHSSPRNVFEDYSENPRSTLFSLLKSLKTGTKPAKDTVRSLLGNYEAGSDLFDRRCYCFKQQWSKI